MYLTILLFACDLMRLKLNVLEVSKWKIAKLYRNPYQYIILLIMNYQPTNFGDEGSCPVNLGKILKVE